MTTYYLVWGNPRAAGEHVVFTREIAPEDVRLSVDGQYAHFDVGPVPVSGPVISRENDEHVTVLVDQAIPEWVTGPVLADWGWHQLSEVPRPARYPFPVDILVLSMNWAGAFEGWSRSHWLDGAVRPMQRFELPVAPDASERISVRILETGTDQHGVGYAVAFAPEREQIDGLHLVSKGWRSEPWVRIRRKSWMDLADLSDCIETHVVTALRSPIITDVTIHDLNAINGETFSLLPADVRDALESALQEDFPEER